MRRAAGEAGRESVTAGCRVVVDSGFWNAFGHDRILPQPATDRRPAGGNPRSLICLRPMIPEIGYMIGAYIFARAFEMTGVAKGCCPHPSGPDGDHDGSRDVGLVAWPI